MATPVRPSKTLSAEVIQVIKTVSRVGRGIDGDPVRHVIQYWSFDGQELAENDPVYDNNLSGKKE